MDLDLVVVAILGAMLQYVRFSQVHYFFFQINFLSISYREYIQIQRKNSQKIIKKIAK
jgi:hypothetical protein